MQALTWQIQNVLRVMLLPSDNMSLLPQHVHAHHVLPEPPLLMPGCAFTSSSMRSATAGEVLAPTALEEGAASPLASLPSNPTSTPGTAPVAQA
jgi:hypothetical protein